VFLLPTDDTKHITTMPRSTPNKKKKELTGTEPKLTPEAAYTPHTPTPTKTGTSTPRRSRTPLAQSPLQDSPSLEPLLPPKIRRSFVITSGLDELDPFVERSRTAKRNFSEASALSDKESRRKERKGDEDDDPQVSSMLAISNNLDVIKTHLKSLEAELEEGRNTISVLSTSWKEGDVNITKQEYNDQIRKLELRVGDLLTKILTIRTSRFRLAGEMEDTKLLHAREDTEDWAYIDQLIWRYAELEGNWTLKSHRDLDQQERWRKAMFKAYDAYNKETGQVWCPITGGWMYSEWATAAHVVRQNVPEWAAGHLFGEAKAKSGHIWSTANGIPLATIYEKMLDNAEMAIVPSEQDGELQVIVLDKEEAEKVYLNQNSPKGKGLHQRKLTFRNDHRPALRYLYFAFAINILRRQRHEAPGWWRDRAAFGLGHKMWGSPGPWLKASMLRKLARRVGHICEDDADPFWGSPAQPSGPSTDADHGALSREREETATVAIQAAYQAHNLE
jgi:hypothetical protein